MVHKLTFRLVVFLLCLELFSSCEKWIEIPPSIDTITNTESSQDSLTMSGAINGLYSVFSHRLNGLFCSGILNISTGLYSDELQTADQSFFPYSIANLLSNDVNIRQYYWGHLYATIYHCNLIIENANSSNRLTETAKKRFIGESKFIRAISYFYLVNTFGDVPIILVPSYKANTNVSRDPMVKVYDQIITDLKESKSFLPSDFKGQNNERVRVTSYSAAALLAKVYLYQKNYLDAIKETNFVLDVVDKFKLEDDLRNTFNNGSMESILQFSVNSSFYPFDGTGDGLRFVNYKFAQPLYYFSSDFIKSIEPGDERWKWIDSTDINGRRFYTPYKYTIGEPQMTPNGQPIQYTTLFRTAELILIRAEAKIKSGAISDAFTDINLIRHRAHLLPKGAMDEHTAMEILEKERRIELFCEQGNRWFDIKRWGRADEINSKLKPNWDSHKLLFPIPASELQYNSKMTQNPGYN